MVGPMAQSSLPAACGTLVTPYSAPYLAQVAARELRLAAEGGSSKGLAQHSTAWAQRTIQVVEQLLHVCLSLFLLVACSNR